MKTYVSATGPFLERPYYKQKEIEQICTDELQNTNLYPANPSPIRIERFIEKRFGISVTYDELPDGLLGFTQFGPKGVEAIVITRSLDSEGTWMVERRIRTTMAHEVGHGLLHTHLILLEVQARPLFGDGLDPKLPRILCRTDGMPGASGTAPKEYDSRWWEFQANQIMGSLLLPKALVEKALDGILLTRGVFGMRILESAKREDAARLLARVFEVNPVVARIRLSALYPEGEENQLTL